MNARRSGEEGMALLVVIVLMGVMLSAGLAVLSTVDVQTSASRTERVRDSAFNLAESALHAQMFALGRDWPGLGRAALPYLTCTQASTSSRCPENASLISGGSSDLGDATWKTSVRDNGAGSVPTFYSDESTQLQPGYDANNDGKVWVRSQAVAQGRKRTLVGLVRAEMQEEDLPHGALIAGSIEISNKGNKALISANGGPVAARCSVLVSLLTPCLGHGLAGATSTLASLLNLLSTQVTGVVPTDGYVAGDAMTAEARARMKSTAISNGTYFTVCPTEAQLSAQVVYIENVSNCFYGNNGVFNSLQAPGALILDGSTITFGGTTKFFGVIYGANQPAGTATVQTQGNSALINGGVIIDGNAKMVIGSSGLNINFDVNAFRAVASYGGAGVIQNTFREIRAE